MTMPSNNEDPTSLLTISVSGLVADLAEQVAVLLRDSVHANMDPHLVVERRRDAESLSSKAKDIQQLIAKVRALNPS